MSDVVFGAFDVIGHDDGRLAADVSDYVSGRLEGPAEREFERRARYDGRVADAIIEAKAVKRRVERRFLNNQLPGN